MIILVLLNVTNLKDRLTIRSGGSVLLTLSLYLNSVYNTNPPHASVMWGIFFLVRWLIYAAAPALSPFHAWKRSKSQFCLAAELDDQRANACQGHANDLLPRESLSQERPGQDGDLLF